MESSPPSDFYEVLGLPPTATAEEIKRKYRTLALERHPDKDGGTTADFQLLGTAYETLRDPDKRADYDFLRSNPPPPPPTSAPYPQDSAYEPQDDIRSAIFRLFDLQALLVHLLATRSKLQKDHDRIHARLHRLRDRDRLTETQKEERVAKEAELEELHQRLSLLHSEILKTEQDLFRQEARMQEFFESARCARGWEATGTKWEKAKPPSDRMKVQLRAQQEEVLRQMQEEEESRRQAEEARAERKKEQQSKKTSCSHEALWDRINGQQRCSRCQQGLRKNAFKCPGCEKVACAKCRRVLRGEK